MGVLFGREKKPKNMSVTKFTVLSRGAVQKWGLI